jgi:hypothetical protein
MLFGPLNPFPEKEVFYAYRFNTVLQEKVTGPYHSYWTTTGAGHGMVMIILEDRTGECPVRTFSCYGPDSCWKNPQGAWIIRKGHPLV